MSINFSEAVCQSHSNKKRFGLCDDPYPSINPAYINEIDGAKWIAVVDNEHLYETTFTAIDRCIDIKRMDGAMEKRCDGVLTYQSTVIFVELKERGALGNSWVKDGEQQLRASIGYFELTEQAENYAKKKAYIANSEHPKFKESQARRMDQFLSDTGYVLRIENRIILE
jgi:hypothetical protein